jgi:hypothetical protein
LPRGTNPSVRPVADAGIGWWNEKNRIGIDAVF